MKRSKNALDGRDGVPAPSRRDVLRHGAVAAPGVLALVGLGAVTFGAGEGAAAGQTAVRREVSDMVHRDKARYRKLLRAVAGMQQRSKKNPDDPAGWLANARDHFRGCIIDEDLPPEELKRDRRQVHFCWWFLPWHRAYLSVTEKKIQEIAEDATIGLPYWNWSVERTLPAPYARRTSPLFHEKRYGPAEPLSDEAVGYAPKFARQGYGVKALAEKRFSAKPGSRSFGGPPRPNPGRKFSAGAIEAVPHNPLHDLVGGERDLAGQTFYGDMADLAVAAQDPVFFAHHGNIDRLWEIWRQDPKRRATEPTSDKFLDHAFVFQDLRGLPVEIHVRDVLDTHRLGYRYDSLDVFGGRAAPRAAPAAPATGPALATRRVAITGRAGEMLTLSISDIETVGRAATFQVFVGPASGATLGTSVGIVSVVLSRGVGTLPEVLIDVTDAVALLPASTQMATVTLLAEALDGLPAPTVSIGAMEIRAETD